MVCNQMQVLFQRPTDDLEWDLGNALSSKLESLLAQEEAHWKQRSKASWLRNRDRNTRYFHQKPSNHRRKNNLQGLFDANGNWCTSAGDIEQVVVDYFPLCSCPIVSYLVIWF